MNQLLKKLSVFVKVFVASLHVMTSIESACRVPDSVGPHFSAANCVLLSIPAKAGAPGFARNMPSSRSNTQRNGLASACYVETQGFMRHEETLAAPHRVIPAQAGIQVCP